MGNTGALQKKNQKMWNYRIWIWIPNLHYNIFHIPKNETKCLFKMFADYIYCHVFLAFRCIPVFRWGLHKCPWLIFWSGKDKPYLKPNQTTHSSKWPFVMTKMHRVGKDTQALLLINPLLYREGHVTLSEHRIQLPLWIHLKSWMEWGTFAFSKRPIFF